MAMPPVVKLRQLHHSVAVPRHKHSAAVTLLLPMPGESYSSSVPGADSRRRRHTAYIFCFCSLCPRHMAWMRQRDTLYCVSLNMCVGACLDAMKGQQPNPLELGVHFSWPSTAQSAAVGRTGHGRPLDVLLTAKLVELKNGEHSAATPAEGYPAFLFFFLA